MSAITNTWDAVTGQASGRPRYGQLFAPTLFALVIGTVCLWALQAVLAIAALWPSVTTGKYKSWIWVPWRVTGLWSALAIAGVALFGTALVAQIIGERVVRRGVALPDPGWTRLIVAVAGYGSLLAGHRLAAHALVAAVATPLLLKFVAYSADREPREWRWSLAPRQRRAFWVAVFVVTLSYTFTHAFSAEGGSSSGSSGDAYLTLGGWKDIDVDMQGNLIPSQITGVSLSGLNSDALVTRTFVLSTSDDGAPEAVDVPGTTFAKHTPLPYRLPIHSALSLSLAAKLPNCAHQSGATVTGVTLDYKMLGVPMAQYVPLSQPASFSCSRNH